MAKSKTIILGVTGSIACYKSAELVSIFKKKGYKVSVVMTPEAHKFIAPLTFQTLSGGKVYMDMFEAPEEWDTRHISLAKAADLILIAPATANIIGKIAGGICDDLLTTTVMASRAPILMAPAMNSNMYTNKIMQENLSKLKRLGMKFVGPGQGRLACGIEGIGRLAEVSDIVKAAEKLLK